MKKTVSLLALAGLCLFGFFATQVVNQEQRTYHGRLVVGHELHVFRSCDSETDWWASDPQNLLLDEYTRLTQNQPAYTEVHAIVTGVVVPVEADNDGFAADFEHQVVIQELLSMDAVDQHPECSNPIFSETIYFSNSSSEWHDDHGICYSCTPENGFGVDGSVDDIIWRELKLSLRNDAGESPPIDEVRTLFQTHYAEESGYYPVHVFRSEDVFTIHVPVPLELKDIDFLDARGALLATYDVVNHSEQLRDDEEIARAFAESTETYIQDGYDLRLSEPQQSTCARCFDFEFSHYGDPGVVYRISVQVSDDGVTQLADTIGTVIYRDVNVIDVESGEIARSMAIVVDGEKIAAVLPENDVDNNLYPNAEVVDGNGWYAIPGLIDSHVHLATLPEREWAEATLYRQIYAGVTSVRDMAGDSRAVAELSRRSRIREIAAPDVYFSALMAGPSFFDDPRTVMSALGATPGEVPWMQAIDDDTDLARAVTLAMGTYATGLKIYANLPGETVRRVTAEARRQNFPVWAHLRVYPATPYDSIESGSTTMSHICRVAQYVLYPDVNSYQASFQLPADDREFRADDPAVSAIFSAMARNDVILDATISMYSHGDPPGQPDDDEEDARMWNCTPDIVRDLTRQAHAHGVRLVAGTDWGTPGDDRFPALYYELEALGDGTGLSAVDVLRTGTIYGAAALGLDEEFGSIEAGKFANIAFTEKNPLDDIRNLRSIVLTVKRGTQYPRADYEHRAPDDVSEIN